MVKNEERPTGVTQPGFKDINTHGSLWSREYDSWKEAKNQTSGSGISGMSDSGWNSCSSSSSSASNSFNWDKAVNDSFKEKHNKK
jgi:hypothetical protein